MGSPFSWFDTNAANDEARTDREDQRVAPGKRTLTSRIPGREGGGRDDAGPVWANAAGGTAPPADDPFGLHLGPDPSIAHQIHEKLHTLLFRDEEGALALLRSDPDRRFTCRNYQGAYGAHLWDDFRSKTSGDVQHQALALLRPHMSLLQRLETHKGTFDDDEGAILQTILDASDTDLQAAPVRVLDGFIRELPAPDAYRARSRAWPARRVANMVAFLEEADGYVFEDKGPVASALLAMTPAERLELWTQHNKLFDMFWGADREKIRRMCEAGPNRAASQTDAIAARMELATEGLGTDEDGVDAAVAAAGNTRDERARVNAALAAGKKPDGTPLTDADVARLQDRRAELGDIDTLLEPTTTAGGKLDRYSFLGSVQDDMDPAAADRAMAVARAGTYERTKQLLLGTIGTAGINVDEEEALRILREVQGDLELAPGEAVESLKPDDVRRRRDTAAAALRTALMKDPDLAPVWKALSRAESVYARELARGDGVEAAIHELTDAFGNVDTDEHRILDIICGLTAEDRVALRTRNPRILDRIRAWPFADHRFLHAFDLALATGTVPAGLRLDVAFGRDMDGTDVAMANDALGRFTPEQRARFRRGYLLERRRANGEEKATVSKDDQEARDAYRGLRDWMASELGEEQLDAAIERLIGLPTVAEMQSPAGRLDAVAILRMRQRERLEMTAHLTDKLTTTDDAAVAAHVEFEASYNAAVADGELTEEEFAVLVHLDAEFNARFGEYASTANMVSEIAGTVAAVAAAAVAIVLSGGAVTAASPGIVAWLSANSTVIAASTAAGALFQVAGAEAAGGNFNDALGADGAKQLLAGGLNGALAVCGAALAEEVASMIGLSGRALTAQIARAAADATATALPGKAFARGALTGLIDGALGGAVGDLAMTLTDAETWRRSVWQVLARAGEALLHGGVTGGATGAATGGLMEMAQRMIQARALRNVEVTIDDALGRTARIEYDPANPAGTLRLRFGARVTDADLEIHVDKVLTLRRALKLSARAADELGTLSGEARHEADKIQKLIDDRVRQLRAELSPESRDVIEGELDLLEFKLDEFRKVAESGDTAEALGVIGQPDRPSAKYPEPPANHYYRRRGDGWDLQLYPDAPEDAERFTLKAAGRGKFEIAEREAAAHRSVTFGDGTKPKRAFDELMSTNPSFKQYVEMLEQNGFADRRLLIDSLIEPGGRTHDAVRHAFKQTWEPYVLARTAGMSEADSVVELRRLTADLNPSDRGNLTEAWYRGRNAGLSPHPEMTRARNPGLVGRDGRGVRAPDFVEGDELVELKSTGHGLSADEVTQINDDLLVCGNRGTVTLEDGATRKVRRMRLVFTDIDGARGAAKNLQGWLDGHATFNVEVFGSGGTKTVINQDNLGGLLKKHKAADLAALLDVL